MSEHNARLANVEAGTNDIAEEQVRIAKAQERVEGEIKAIDSGSTESRATSTAWSS